MALPATSRSPSPPAGTSGTDGTRGSASRLSGAGGHAFSEKRKAGLEEVIIGHRPLGSRDGWCGLVQDCPSSDAGSGHKELERPAVELKAHLGADAIRRLPNLPGTGKVGTQLRWGCGRRSR